MGSALFAIYTPWLHAEVGWEDSAFFQLCHATLGVPHGPGFPLYVLLGRLCAAFLQAPALASNLLSAAALAAAGVVLFEIILLLQDPSRDRLPRGWAELPAFAVVAGWATLPVQIVQAARAEVYTLVLLLVLCTWYAALRSQRGKARAWACATAWCWGLAMAVHPLIALCAATPAWIFAWRATRVRLSVLSLFALGPMSLYLFPIVRGRVEGAWAWGDFGSVGTLFDYFTRRSAWSAVVTSDGGFVENLAGWWWALPELWPTLLWLPALWGLWHMRRQWLFAAAFVLVGALLLWAAPFDPTNLDLFGYALPALAVLAAGTGHLLLRLAAIFRAHWPGLSAQSRAAYALAFSVVTAAWPASSLWAAASSGRTGAGDIVSHLEETLPLGAVLFASEDNLFGVLEFARSQSLRPDLQVVSLGALHYPHYRSMLRERLSGRITSGWDYVQFWDEARWRAEVQALFARRESGDPWFVQFERLPGLSARQLQPRGLVAAIGSGTALGWQSGLAFFQSRAERLGHGPEREAWARWIFNFGALALEAGHVAQGWEAMHLALDVSPAQPEMYYVLGRSLQRAGRRAESQALFSAAVELAPYRQRYRDALGTSQADLAVQP